MASKFIRKLLSTLGCSANTCDRDTSMADNLERVAADISSNAHSLSESERMRVLATCSKLSATVETPVQALFNLMFGPHQITAVRIAMEMGLFEFMASRRGEAVGLSQLATAINVDSALLTRIMRVLTASGVMREERPEVYASAPMAHLLVIPPLRDAVSLIFDEHTAVLPSLPSYLKSTNFRNPVDPIKGPFQHAFNTPLGFFDWLETRPDRLRVFESAMAGQREGRGQDWFKYANVDEILLKDWRLSRHRAKTMIDSANSSELSIEVLAREIIDDKDGHEPHDNSNVLLVDIGGGTGHDLAAFTAAKPELFSPSSPYRLVLQDLPNAIALARSQQPPLPPHILPFVHDFFTPQPIKGARAYYFRTIFHDWPDSHCRVILQHTLDAMGPKSKLLINEYVLPEKGVAVFPACLDLSMMATKGGQERTERDWRNLVESVGGRWIGVTGQVGGEGVWESLIVVGKGLQRMEDRAWFAEYHLTFGVLASGSEAECSVMPAMEQGQSRGLVEACLRIQRTGLDEPDEGTWGEHLALDKITSGI